MQTLKVEMRRLPAAYSRDIRAEKMARAYAHVYDLYTGRGPGAVSQYALGRVVLHSALERWKERLRALRYPGTIGRYR